MSQGCCRSTKIVNNPNSPTNESCCTHALSHGTHTNEWCHIYRATTLVNNPTSYALSHGTRMNESCHIYRAAADQWHLSTTPTRQQMNYVAHMRWVMAHIWMIYVIFTGLLQINDISQQPQLSLENFQYCKCHSKGEIHTATHCNILQHTATHWNILQHTATHCNTLQHTATHCNILQHTTTHCNTLQHTATHCNTLQGTATRCIVS